MDEVAEVSGKPDRMKVVTVTTGLNVGGAELSLLRLLAHTRESFDHTVISLAAGGGLAPAIREIGVPVLEAGLGKDRLPVSRLRHIAREIKGIGPNLLIGQMYHGNVAASIIRGVLPNRPPLLWTIHYSPENVWRDRLSTQIAFRASQLTRRSPAKIVYVSERSARIHGEHGFPSEKAVIIPNGYDLQDFQFDGDARARRRTEWGFTERDFIIGHVARVSPMKDHATMIDALCRAVSRDRRIAAVFAGAGTEALRLPDSLRARVRLLGLRPDMPAVMSACDIGCLSSSFGEALPNALGEFFACERPCASTDVGDCAKLVGEHGVIVPPRNAGALSDAFVGFAAMDDVSRMAMGSKGRRSMLENFDIRSVARSHTMLWLHTIRADPWSRPN